MVGMDVDMKRFKTLLYRTGLETLHYSGACRVSALRDEGVGVILTLHHVRPDAGRDFAPNRELEITPEFLEVAIEAMQAEGITFVSLDEVSRRLAAPHEGGRFAAVTFDDGYRDNRDIALPIFRRYGVPFTVFVTSQFAAGTAMLWWKVVEEVVARHPVVTFHFETGPVRFETGTAADKEAAADRISTWARRSEPSVVIDRVQRFATDHGVDPLEPTRREIMTVEELRDLAADPLASIGAHTRTHPNIRLLGEAEAVSEMIAGADELAEMLGTRPRHFSFPYGSACAAGPRDFALASRTGFDLAVTTRPGVIRAEHAHFRTALPRISLNGYFQRRKYLDVLLSGVPFRIANGFRRLDVA